MEKLKQFETFFKKQYHAKEIPDGHYSVTVIDTDTAESKYGDPQLWLHLKIDEGKYSGTIFRKVYTIKSEASVGHLYGDVELCGIPATSLRDVFERHSSFLNLRILVTKSTKGEDSSIYFVKLRGKSSGDIEPVEPEEVA